VGISVGGIDIAGEIVDLHFQLRRTQLLLDSLNTKASGSAKLTAEDVTSADRRALEFVQKKFPEMGITKKG
jgi:hypothetical protein